MAVNFRLFNCDRTFNLDKVEALIQRVAKKISREIKIEKTYFPLPRMKELCEELEKGDGSHFEYAVFVVHAHESRLSINEKNAGIGYARVYRALQKVTDDKVLVVIGGDDNYKGQEERDKSVLSRWAWLKICSQFTEEYVNGMKSFIFSWEENHHPIHEEALEFYLDPTKKGTKFEPRPRPPPVKAPEKKETKKTEQAKLLELKKQELETMATRKYDEQFPPKRNESRTLPSRPEEAKRTDQSETQDELKRQHPQTMGTRDFDRQRPEGNESYVQTSLKPEFGREGMTDHSLRVNENGMEYHVSPDQAGQASAARGTPNVHILSFHASKASVDGVVSVFEDVYKQLTIASKPKASADTHMDIKSHIMKYKPGYLVLVSEYDNIEDMSSLDNQGQRYRDIVKTSASSGTKLIFIITEDKKYREGFMSSDAVNNIFTRLNQDIPRSDQPMVMSWTKTPWPTHRDTLVQLLTPYGCVQAVPKVYGSTKQDPTSSVLYTQPAGVPRKRHFYKASISYGRVVKVLGRDPPNWLPDSFYLNDLIMKHQSEENAIVELRDEGDGKVLGTVYSSEVFKVCKVAEGVATDNKHSLLVYSYHFKEETKHEVTKVIHALDVPELLPCQPIEPASLLTDITCAKPDYVMLFADIEVFKDEAQVKQVLQEYETNIKDVIEKCVGEAVIVMLFGDKSNKEGKFGSKETTQYVRVLTQGIVPRDRLAVMTCWDRPYTTHLDYMKGLLYSKGAAKSAASQGAVPSVPSSKQHYYKAVMKKGQITEVLEHNPPDWQPDEGIVRKQRQENKNLKKAVLEVFGNDKGEVSKIAVDPKGPMSFTKKLLTNPTSLFSSDDVNSDEDEGVEFMS